MWFKPKLPVDQHQKDWLEHSIMWLHSQLRTKTFCRSETILPIDNFFPSTYNGDVESATELFHTVTSMMDIPDSAVRLEICSDNNSQVMKDLPYVSHTSTDSAGHICLQKRAGKYVIRIEGSQLEDPFSLVAVIAHELSHVLLLGGNLLESTDKDHELMADLTTVYYGLGIFSANCAFSFKQSQGDGQFGWSARKIGYLSEPMFGYALALYARMRNEFKPLWASHLDRNVRAYFESSQRYIKRTGDCRVIVIC